MSIILDVILLTVFAAFVFTAAKKGFMQSLLELVAVILALVLSYQLSPVVAQSAYDSVVEKSLIKTVEAQLDETLNISSSTAQAETILEAIPDFMVSFASSSGIEIDEIKAKITSESISAENIATELVQKVAQPIVVAALTAVLFLILSIVLIFALKFVAGLLSKLFKLPLIGTVNKVLGGVLGGCKGVMVIILISTVLKLVFSGNNDELGQAVNSSFVVGLSDNINPFIKSLTEIVL
ncbi:MAG: CvpA family protein [Clostridia bacterium]|nr:CvpA family protein [Clostridia bacterium]